MNRARVLRSASFLGALAAASLLCACSVEPSQSAPEETDTDDIASTSEAIHDAHFRNPLVLQDSAKHQKKYVNETKGWLRWVMALPWSTGPVNDTTGAQCALGQSGETWYLAGTEGGAVTRDCTIPENKKLFFPLRNTWSIPPADLVDEPSELASFISFFTDYFPEDRAETCTLSLRLDGHDLQPDFASLDQNLWVQILDPFKIFVNTTDNWAGYAGGHMPAALVDGHYALLKPLSPGDHTLEFSATQCDDEDGTYFDTSATYHLHVQGGEPCDTDD